MRRVPPSIASAAVFALLIGCYLFMYTPFKQSPGRVSVAPGRVSVAPGRVSVAPGRVSVAPGRVSVAPGRVSVAPGRVSVAPGRFPFALRGGHNVLRSPTTPSSLATPAELKKIRDARGRNYALNFKPRYLSESVQLCKMISNFTEEESSSVFERFSDGVLCSQFEERRNGDCTIKPGTNFWTRVDEDGTITDLCLYHYGKLRPKDQAEFYRSVAPMPFRPHEKGFTVLHVQTPKDYVFTQYGLYKKKNVLYVAFRGSKTVTDWLINLSPGLREMGKYKIMVHSGMYTALHPAGNQSIPSMINDKIVKEIKADDSINTLVFCGHSLGGAYAQITLADFLGSDEFKDIRNRLCKNQNLYEYRIYSNTFGSPQVFIPPEPQDAPAWWSSFHVNNDNHVFKDDLIPRLATHTWFQHVIPDFVDLTLSGPLHAIIAATTDFVVRVAQLLQIVGRTTENHAPYYFQFEPVGDIVFLHPKTEEKKITLYYGSERIEKGGAKEVLRWYPSSIKNVLHNHKITNYVDSVNRFVEWARKPIYVKDEELRYERNNSIIDLSEELFDENMVFQKEVSIRKGSPKRYFFKMEFDGKVEIKVERAGINLYSYAQGVLAHHFKRGGKVLKTERVEFKSWRNFKHVMDVTKDDILIFRMKCEGYRTPFLSTRSKIKIRRLVGSTRWPFERAFFGKA